MEVRIVVVITVDSEIQSLVVYVSFILVYGLELERKS